MWTILWTYRKYIGLGLLLAGAITAFALYRHSLIQHGRELCETEYSQIIDKAQKQGLDNANKAEIKRIERDEYIYTSDSTVNAVPVASGAIMRLYDNKGDNR